MKKLSFVVFLLLLVFSRNVVVAKDVDFVESIDKTDIRLFGFIDNIGFDWQYGKDEILPDSVRGDHCYNTVNRFSVRAESRGLWFFPEKWSTQGELYYSAHKIDEVPDNSQDTSFKEIGFNLIIKRFFFDDLFYLGFFGGLSKPLDFPEFEKRDWKDRDIESNLGRSGILGSWGPIIGKDWKFVNTPWSLKTELRPFCHTSDPFTQNDRGKNYTTMVIGISYNF